MLARTGAAGWSLRMTPSPLRATAALVARPGRYRPDFSALESDQFFVFPWDYASLVADGRFEPGATSPGGKASKPRRAR